MPDLPLPKPQPPQAVPTPDVVHVPAPSSPSAVAPVSKSPSVATPVAPSPSPATPTGVLQSPAVAPPMKPPAVVTALSSVSSHQIPSQVNTADADSLPSSDVHASSLPSSASTIYKPPTLRAPGTSAATAGAVTAVIPTTPQAVHSAPQPQVTTPISKPTSTPTPISTPTPLPPSKPIIQEVPPAPTLRPPTTAPSLTTAPLPPPPLVKPQGIPPALVKPKKSKKGIILLMFGMLIALLVIGGAVVAFLSRSSTQSADTDTSGTTAGTGQGTNGSTPQTSPAPVAVETTLEYWGLWEPSEVLNSVLTEFQTQNPTIAVRYVQQSYKDYRERLQTAIASGNGPDLFRYHASWVPMLQTELEPLPAAVMSPSEFAQTFYPIASKQLQQNGQLVGIPLEYDGLVLYYNQDILETAGIQPPKTWAELREAAKNLKIPKTGSPLQRGGLAIGTADNVDHFADIIAVLMLQNGADLQQPNTPEGRDALLFYTNFVTQDQVWSADLPTSTVAFARGDVAMMFAPSWRAFDIVQQNPSLRFATVPLPQLPNTQVTWGTFWAEGVSKQSKSKDAAWKLLKYLSSKDGQQKLFTSQAQVRPFGEPYSRVDLADQLSSNKVVGSILQDAPNALGWYMSTMTHDNGINDQINTYYTDAVNSLLKGGSINQVLQTLQLGVNQVLGTYGVIAPVEPTPTPKTY